MYLYVDSRTAGEGDSPVRASKTKRYCTFRGEGLTRVTHSTLKQKQIDRRVACSLILEEKDIQSTSFQALTV